MAAKMKFSATALVWIWLRPKGKPKGDADMLDDGGLQQRLNHFLEQSDIWHATFCGGRFGGDTFAAGFYPEDAEKVVAWLADQGAAEVTEWRMPKKAHRVTG